VKSFLFVGKLGGNVDAEQGFEDFDDFAEMDIVHQQHLWMR
jgi:hypothetical protein